MKQLSGGLLSPSKIFIFDPSRAIENLEEPNLFMIFFKNFFEKRIKIEEPENKEIKEPAEEKRQPIRRESSSPPPRTQEEEILERGERISSAKLDGGSGSVYFVSFKNDGDGVFKPKSGSEKERAAYLVDRFIGFDFVPPTVVRTIDGERGSVQKFIADAKEICDTPQEERDSRYKPDLIKLWIFDYIIWNADRHGGNALVKNGKVYAIDHGYTFLDRNALREYKSYLNELIPQEIIEK